MATLSEALGIALDHHRAGRLQAAEQVYRAILAAHPDHPDALHLLGVLASQVGRHDLAVDYIGAALRRHATDPAYHNHLGDAYRALRRFPEAGGSYRQALRLRPDFAEAHNNLGIALQEQGQVQQAVACYREALRLQPDLVPAYNNLGLALYDQGRPTEAVACYEEALARQPGYAPAHHNMGQALRAVGRRPEAIACYRRAVEAQPDFAEAYNNLGTALQEQGRLAEAVACFRHVVGLEPGNATALGLLVHQLQHLCSWDGLADLTRRAVEAVAADGPPRAPAMSPFTFLALPTPTSAAEQLHSARRWVRDSLPHVPHGGLSYRPRPPRPAGSKIALGYLSADFRSHPVAYLIAELLEKHDRGPFLVRGYSCGPDDGSPVRDRLRRAFDHFADLREASDDEAARRIHADGVDVLIDLTGYTQGTRTGILAFRPAPVQVNYLGYPGTLGAPFVDYILVDAFVVPPDQQPFFAERLVHLPGCYQVNDSRRPIDPRTPSRAECGLPEAGFVFAAFNNSYKINPEMFDAWVGLLRDEPGSVLWLLEANAHAADNLRREAAARGVDPRRLAFAPRLPLAEHLARHRVADLFLDTFPYNGHTTASDALWAGLPVLTRAGGTFAARVAGSLLRAVGLPELVTSTLKEYRERAGSLARDPAQLAELRARLEANRGTAPLFDAGRFAAGLERAFATMWSLHAAGRPPQAFAVDPPEATSS